MIKERIPISGDLGSKVKQLMEYAGWYSYFAYSFPYSEIQTSAG